MPSLRELLMNVRVDDCGTAIFLEALVEAVEALGANNQMASLAYVHTELAEAKANLERLHKDHRFLLARLGEANDKTRRLVDQLAEAKAEIKKLRPMRDLWSTYFGGGDDDETIGDLFAVVRVDAKIGRLVREMRPGTKLVRACYGDYLAEEQIDAAIQGERVWVWLPGCSPDPAEALRAIQREDADSTEGEAE